MDSYCFLRVMRESDLKWAGGVPSVLGGQVLTLQWAQVRTWDSESREAKVRRMRYAKKEPVPLSMQILVWYSLLSS